MYGFFNSALEKLIRRRFGDDKWEEICEQAGVSLGNSHSFQAHHMYRDGDLNALLQGASEVLGLDSATILEMFGDQFLLWCQEYGHSKMLKVLGRSLQDFITNIDSLHDSLSTLYPQMEAPSFRCTPGHRKTDFYLHYYSKREGLEPVVMGIIKAIARQYYDTEVTVALVLKKGQDGSDHCVFYIQEVAHYKESNSMECPHSKSPKLFPDQQLVSSEMFCKAFPFHLIFDRDLNILQCGATLALLLPSFVPGKQKLSTYFTLERPMLKLTFDAIVSHINTMFVLRMLLSPQASILHCRGSSSAYQLPFLKDGGEPLSFRGQMMYLPESDAVLFLCSPRVKQLRDLEKAGLYLSDIPLHDATRGLFVIGEVAESEFINSVRLEELIIQLQSVQKSLEEEKQRMAGLLREMLPISVADGLMAGRMVEAERFESVTILFSDIVGFTSICSKSEPMQIVNMLNKLYSCFDQCVGQNQVYKVETIGDAYMVVGGLPERNTVHAECVANQALDMMYYSRRVSRPDNNNPIIMRIGIHSGEVVAGIVGLRMPRYCLFGNTVNVASRTESNGIPGRIQVTEHTYSLLKNNPHFSFTYRGPMDFKNVPNPIPCYFLLENSAKSKPTPVTVPFSEDLVPGYDLLPRLTPSAAPFSVPLPSPTAPKTKYSSLLTVPSLQLEQEASEPPFPHHRPLSSSSASSSASSSSSTLLSRDEGSTIAQTLVVPDISVTSWSANTTPTSSRKGSSAEQEIANVLKKLQKQTSLHGLSSEDSDSEMGDVSEKPFAIVPQCPFGRQDHTSLSKSFYLESPVQQRAEAWERPPQRGRQPSLPLYPVVMSPLEEMGEDSMYGSFEGSEGSDLEQEERRGGGRERRRKGETLQPILLNVTGGGEGGGGGRGVGGKGDLMDIRTLECAEDGEKATPLRKISDCSSRSVDSGTKMSEISKDEDESLRKLSVASNMSETNSDDEMVEEEEEEEEEEGEGEGEREAAVLPLRFPSKRGGMVYKKVEFFNDLCQRQVKASSPPAGNHRRVCRTQSEGACRPEVSKPQLPQGSRTLLRVMHLQTRQLQHVIV